MAVQPPQRGEKDGEAPARLAAAIIAAEATLKEPGDAHTRIQAVAKTLPEICAAAKAARDG